MKLTNLLKQHYSLGHTFLSIEEIKKMRKTIKFLGVTTLEEIL